MGACPRGWLNNGPFPITWLAYPYDRALPAALTTEVGRTREAAAIAEAADLDAIVLVKKVKIKLFMKTSRKARDMRRLLLRQCFVDFARPVARLDCPAFPQLLYRPIF